MNPRFILILIVVVVICGIGYAVFLQRPRRVILEPKLDGSINVSPEKHMNITSRTFENNAAIPAKYTCDGGNVNPALEIQDVPQGAKSLVLIVDDPDAPGGTWVHWAVWNIDPKTAEIPQHGAPAGATEGVTSFGKPGYGGPCPPSGTHRYFFKLYALNAMLDLLASADVAALEKAMEGHVLEKAELIGLYHRG